ncbi:type II toxin-antitoxin system VapC family toxin [Deinococcus marmoris]|uniref:type II toxin-antitoxin system VapC family toxin n=1 Tax=Deinococcus marmoris TaxID=249408 RepID=UPI00068D8FA5|nr:type II toxin-antitoxin system VapC family toxin [Deinococcus marmoris]
MSVPLRRVLLDTNVISEPTRPRPSPSVLAYLAALAPNEVFLSLLTLGELETGILLAQDPRRAVKLRRWLDHQIKPAYSERLLTPDDAVVRRWGEFMALPAVRARQSVAVDALIAATASVHRLNVVTRNQGDFSVFPVDSYDPWTYATD